MNRTISQDPFFQMVMNAGKHGRMLAERLVGRGTFEPLKLYYRKSTSSQHGDLRLFPASQVPDGEWLLAAEDTLGAGVPYDRYSAWVWDRSVRLEVLCPSKI